VAVITYNRPKYLDRALTSIFKAHPGRDVFPVYVSQDGANEAITSVVKRHGAHSLVHPRKALELPRGSYIAKMPGYAYLSVHYSWAMRTLFGMGGDQQQGGGAPYAGVIVLEEDIEVSADFFDYFNATAWLLDQDPSLLCISAYNDNGQGQYAGDPRAMHRSDFFPGLGWLLSRRLWSELDAKWPEQHGFWDDWLREKPQRKDRASIRPEVSRTKTFGEKGTSIGLFYKKYLNKIALVQEHVHWAAEDVSYLLKDKYEALFQQWIGSATIVTNLEAAKSKAAEGVGGDVLIKYENENDLVRMCKRLGLMEDLKAGVPRTAYHGVVMIRVNSRRLFLAPSYHVDQDITDDGHGVLRREVADS